MTLGIEIPYISDMNFPKHKVILTGFRATGKSSVGKRLAARLNVDFVDMDTVIEEQQGCSIRQMVADHGWEFFRAKEQQLLKELINKDNAVIATGGGAILHQEVWQQLMQTGLSVWLTADLKTIGERLANDSSTEELRPSLTGKDIRSEIESVLANREPLYRQGSHLIIDTAKYSVDDIVEIIETTIAEKSSQNK